MFAVEAAGLIAPPSYFVKARGPPPSSSPASNKISNSRLQSAFTEPNLYRRRTQAAGPNSKRLSAFASARPISAPIERWRASYRDAWAPLGYDVKDRKLVVSDAEAATVRIIFQRFLRVGSMTKLTVALRSDALDLEKRWSDEVAPHLAASGVEDLDGLAARVEDAQALDAALKVKDTELESLRGQLASPGDSADKLSEAMKRVETCRAELGGVSLDLLASDLAALGSDPIAALRGRRQNLTTALDTARATAAKASTAFTLAAKRSSTSQAALEAAIVARDVELVRFPESLTTELSAAQAAAAAASEEQKTIARGVVAREDHRRAHGAYRRQR